MKRRWLIGMAVLTAVSTAALFVLVGCGGGGGPIGPPPGAGGGAGGAQAAFRALLPAAQQNATYVGTPKCQTCHGDKYHAGWQNTMHAQNNVGCEQCHGPGSVHVADQSKAPRIVTASLKMPTRSRAASVDILTFPDVTRPEVCAQCHGPISDDFNASKHALFVPDPVNAGSACIRCHSAPFHTQMIDVSLTKHEIDPTLTGALDPTGIDSAINALSAAQLTAFANATQQTATCATCHDPHTQTPQSVTNDARVSGNQVRHATFNTDTTNVAPGASEATYTTMNQICAQCHNARGGGGSDAALLKENSRQNFHEGPQYNMLMGLTGALGTGTIVQTSSHAQAPDQCVHCHMPQTADGHISHTWTVQLDGSCVPCHSTADAAARESALKAEITNDLLALLTRMQAWAKATFGNQDFWDYPANITSGTPPNQSLIPIQIRRARHDYHFVVQDNSFGVHNAPYVRQLIDYSNQQLDALGVAKSPVPPATKSARVNFFRAELARERALAAHADPSTM